jgi:hypothetical protein
VLLSLSVSGIVASGIAALTDSLSFQVIGNSTAIVFTGATILYKIWFQHSRLNRQLERGADQSL